MDTIILILILFLLTIFGTLLYFKSKKERHQNLENGICPQCFAQTKRFKDENTHTTFEVSPIEQRVIRNHGCSGIFEVEYTCKACGLKEIHNTISQGCSL